MDWLYKWSDMYGLILIAQLVGASERGSVVVGSNPTQAIATYTAINVNIYIYIYIYIYINTYNLDVVKGFRASKNKNLPD